MTVDHLIRDQVARGDLEIAPRRRPARSSRHTATERPQASTSATWNNWMRQVDVRSLRMPMACVGTGSHMFDGREAIGRIDPILDIAGVRRSFLQPASPFVIKKTRTRCESGHHLDAMRELRREAVP